MAGWISIKKALVFATSVIALANGAACPYSGVGDGLKPRSLLDPEHRLEPRFHTGSDFGRCLSKRLSKFAGGGSRSWDWWPCELSLNVLRQNGKESNPLGADVIYANEFAKLDFEQLKKDITEMQTNSQDWWPADFGNYGGFWIRLSWHNAGTYRAVDGRGGAGEGQQRFAPLNSWPDNQNLDKARRLLWPIKQKYGSKISWADLFVLAGHTALNNMGFPPHGFAAGRVDTWQADEGIFWGAETAMFPTEPGSNSVRYNGSTDIYARADTLEAPLADTNMGLIYVDPEGPSGIPDPKASALDIRKTFTRMAMNDEETVALIAGGHAFGKTHGAVAGKYIGPEPNAAPITEQQLGWKNHYKSGYADNTYTSGLEVIWSETPTKWANHYLHSLLTRNFSHTNSPAGGHQWECLGCNASIPDPFKPNVWHRPRMMTSDIALKEDPIYRNISETFYKDFNLFTEKFGLAWYKLLHRDMGPITRYLGPDIPKGPLKLWQDPVPEAKYQMIDANDTTSLKSEILNTQGLNISNLVTTAWGAAASFRISDKRGGANGGRIQLEPQKRWASNNPARLQIVLNGLKSVQSKFNKANSAKQVSLADLVVLGGTAAVEAAAKAAGINLAVRFTPGRNDTTQALTDISTFKYLKPIADGFVNYGVGIGRSTTEEILVDKAGLLTLSTPEMTVLVGGMRALNANYDGSSHGILTSRPGQLTNDFFVNLLNISTTWQPIANTNQEFFQGNDRASGQPLYTATRSDLILGSHPELRAVSEVYGSADASEKFAKDFASAWSKVMELDRYDLKNRLQDEVQLD